MPRPHSKKRVGRRQREGRIMAALGLPDFETAADCARRQAIMVRTFWRHNLPDELVEGLSDCTPDRCGMVQCIDGCHFASRRLRLRLVPRAAAILKHHPGPLFAVTIVHPRWSWPFDEPFDPKGITKSLKWLTKRLKLSNGVEL